VYVGGFGSSIAVTFSYAGDAAARAAGVSIGFEQQFMFGDIRRDELRLELATLHLE
jgi:hypothetical protein